MKNLAFGLVAGLLVNLVQANTVNIVDISGAALAPGSGIQYTSSCDDLTTDICIQSFLGTSLTDVTLNLNQATGFELGKSSEATQLDTLNTLLSASSLDEVTYINKIDVAGSSFTTNQEYFSIKQSKWTAFFMNKTSGFVTIQFNPNNFSHYTEHGEPVLPAVSLPVPLPALPVAAPLFGSAIGIIVLLAWLRNKKTAV